MAVYGGCTWHVCTLCHVMQLHSDPVGCHGKQGHQSRPSWVPRRRASVELATERLDLRDHLFGRQGMALSIGCLSERQLATALRLVSTWGGPTSSKDLQFHVATPKWKSMNWSQPHTSEVIAVAWTLLIAASRSATVMSPWVSFAGRCGVYGIGWKDGVGMGGVGWWEVVGSGGMRWDEVG